MKAIYTLKPCINLVNKKIEPIFTTRPKGIVIYKNYLFTAIIKLTRSQEKYSGATYLTPTRITFFLESHNVATTGADLNHFVRKILNIGNLDVLVSRLLLFSFLYPKKVTHIISGNTECCEKFHLEVMSI